MQEVKVSKAIINERKELQICLIVKESDFTNTEYELFRLAKINGDLLDLKATGLVNWKPNEELKKLRQKLALEIKTYSNKFHKKEEDIINELYIKYWVKSRSELMESELEEEIESFKTANMSWIA